MARIHLTFILVLLVAFTSCANNSGSEKINLPDKTKDTSIVEKKIPAAVHTILRNPTTHGVCLTNW